MIDSSTREHILRLEHRLLDPVIRRSRQALAQLLADDFVEFTSLGTVCRKREVIDALQHELSQERLIAEFEVVSLAELSSRRIVSHGRVRRPSRPPPIRCEAPSGSLISVSGKSSSIKVRLAPLRHDCSYF
jgi:hypothetical protein